jgi:hypothetical protein
MLHFSFWFFNGLRQKNNSMFSNTSWVFRLFVKFLERPTKCHKVVYLWKFTKYLNSMSTQNSLSFFPDSCHVCFMQRIQTGLENAKWLTLTRSFSFLDRLLLFAVPHNKVLQSATKCCKVLQSVTKYYKVLQSARKCYKVLKAVTKCYKVLKSARKCSKVLQSATKCYKLLQSVTKS